MVSELKKIIFLIYYIQSYQLFNRLYPRLPRSKSNVSILSNEDYERIKRNANKLNNEYINPNTVNDYEIKKNQLILENQRNNRLQKAKAHLQKLKQINKTLSSFHQPLSPTLYNQFNIQFSPIFSHRTNNNQACRDIDVIVKRAKVFNVRDRQIEHNEKMDTIYRKKEENMDKMIEIERLKELKYNEDKKLIIKEKNKEGVKSIIDQIKEKEYIRLIEREKVLKDAELMKMQIKAYEDEELREIEQKKIKKMMLSKTNDEFLNYMNLERLKRKIRDKEEDFRVMKFNKEQNEKKDEELKIQKKLKLLKEQEILKNKEKQEMILEKKEILKELNDKRINEEFEKKQNEKEKIKLIKLENDRKKLIEGYETQVLEKIKQKEKKIKEEHDEFEEIKKRQIIEDENERRKEELKKIQYSINGQELLKQMNEKKEKEKLIQDEKKEERIIVDKNVEEYQKLVEKYKKDKLKELEKLNIKPKYRVELQKYKIV